MTREKFTFGAALVALLVLLWAAGSAIASPPREGPGGEEVTVAGTVASKISYQGRLTDADGDPVSDGTHTMRFQLYDAQSGGTLLWDSGAQSVQVANGLFNVELDVDQSDFNGQELWLAVKVGAETLTPRQQILPVPYALSLRPGAIVEGDSYYGLSSITTSSYGLRGESSNASLGAGVIGENTGGVGDGVQAISDGRAGIAAWGEGAGSYGAYFVSDNSIGVYGTTSSDDTDTPAIKGENTGHGDGVLGIATWYGGIGVYGQSGFGTGVRGEGEVGVSGESGLGPGVLGQGVFGVHGMSDIGTGVYGESSSTSPGTAGVSGYAASPDGYGVYGENGTSTGVGVAGFMSGYDPSDLTAFWKPAGLFGGRNGVVGLTKEAVGIGVLGWSKATTGFSMGVYGQSDSPDGYGVYYVGGLAGVGTKSAIVQTQDYGWRKLYAVESPGNWFEDFGQAQLANGQATVTIDPIFAQTVNLTETYHVFVTPLSNVPILLFVTEKGLGSFTVRGVTLDGSPAEATFDYRIVAKRLGYEDLRLEPAEDPNLVEHSD